MNFWEIFKQFVAITLVFGDGAATTIPENTTDAIPLDAFPLDFTWGVATSSYQIEGAWNKSGKGESIWDHMVHHQPYKIRNCDNGDESADSYKFWKNDVKLLHELGVQSYRFSMSWSRILPKGFSNEINMEGINYYNNLLQELKNFNITPIVTIYHWELPQSLQELGGFTNAEFVNWFKDYSSVLFQWFGDYVKFWITFNEPWQICERGYGSADLAPALNASGVANYICGHHLLKAHAEVYHMYTTDYKDHYGKLGISADSKWFQPLKDTSSDDLEASETAMQYYLGMFMHPIFSKNGNYPPEVINQTKLFSKRQHCRNSRLPEFTPEEVKAIKGSAHFFGLNSYSSSLVRYRNKKDPINDPIPSFYHDTDVIESVDPEWTVAANWQNINPKGIYEILMWIKKEYDNPTVYITGNGMVDNGGTDDIDRVEYYNSYLTYVLQAINDGANVKGYVAYSLLDSFEWEAGFSETFGLYHVDFNSPNKTRSAKMSAKVYKKIVETRKIDETYKPDPDFLIEPVERDDLCKKSIIPRLSTKEDKEGSSKQGQGRSTQGNSGQIKSFNFLSSFLIIDIIFVFKYIFG